MAQLGLCYVGFSYILQVYKKEVKIHLSQQKSLRPKSQSIHHSVMATTTVVNVKWINQLVYRHNNASNDQLLPPVKCETWFVKSLITALDLQPTCVFKSVLTSSLYYLDLFYARSLIVYWKYLVNIIGH